MESKNKKLVKIIIIEIMALVLLNTYLVLHTQASIMTSAVHDNVYYSTKTIVKTPGIRVIQNPDTVNKLLKEVKNSKEKQFKVEIPEKIPCNFRGLEYLREIISEYPEEFGKYNISYFRTDTNITHVQFTYSEKKDKETQKMLETIDDICENAKKKETQSEQIIYVIERISKYCKYNKRTYSNEDAYGCLVIGQARCTGYAQSMQLCMKRLGIPSRYRVSLSMNHIWNQIQVGDRWIDVDLTAISSRQERLKLKKVLEKGII